ncbi:UNVERIFIED_CONTAM: Leukocyte receptor cluster member 1 [Siphonaria sp. JEL0065]|nr:Leukocyte receptor cluster member 1 [Siphonaria sp. JEL0065]
MEIGGLVILKHKSWHVYNAKNIEKVRKDEAKAQKEEDEKKERAVKAEQEYRLEVLRAKSGSRQSRKRSGTEVEDNDIKNSDQAVVSAGQPGVHLNLFGDLESGKATRRADGKNAEHEKEAAEEKAKFEKQFTMYLGQEAGGKPAAVPWYAKETRDDSDRLGVKRLKAEQREDPAAKFRTTEPEPTTAPSFKKEHKKKKDSKMDKKEKSSKKHTHNHSERKQGKSIEELRAERLEREQREHARAQEIFQPIPTLASEREAGYNSAFNPDFARHKQQQQYRHR